MTLKKIKHLALELYMKIVKILKIKLSKYLFYSFNFLDTYSSLNSNMGFSEAII